MALSDISLVGAPLSTMNCAFRVREGPETLNGGVKRWRKGKSRQGIDEGWG